MRPLLVRVGLGWLLGACALTPPPTKQVAKSTAVVIVIGERGPRGIRLVAIDERGDRQFELLAPAPVIVRDSNPTISPDGRWLVFASTRDRTDGGTSLWIAPLAELATPRRLTSEGIDQHPTWAPDGRSIVFATTRAGGDFDLFRLAIADGQSGAATQLTSNPGHEVMPALAPDGTIIYAAIAQRDGLEVESHLEERAVDGTIRQLTMGPADTSPAVSPDGATLVFVRPSLHNNSAHSELWKIERGAWRSREGELPASVLVALPITDESGPVWSRDGRFVFATSVLRGEGGRALFSSIVHVDVHDKAPRARMLVERSGAVARLTPAIRSDRLDAAALASDPEYLPELARIMAAAIAEQSQP
jgi:Tol biopolymer transport system component